MTVALKKQSASEFLNAPEVADETWELVSGEVIVSPRPTPTHAYTVFALGKILDAHIVQNDLGNLYLEVDAVFSDWDVRAPDLLYIAKGRYDARAKKHIDVIPDLCIEVLSPSSIRTDRIDKFLLYQSKGVAHYWIIDPESRTLEGYALENGRYIPSGRAGDQQSLRLPPFPTLEIPLAKLWHP